MFPLPRFYRSEDLHILYGRDIDVASRTREIVWAAVAHESQSQVREPYVANKFG